MLIENLSRPGVLPVDGDFVEVTHDNGYVERKHHFFAVISASQARKLEIMKALSDIDAETGSSRAMREALLDLLPAGKGQGLRGREGAAIALRAELATL